MGEAGKNFRAADELSIVRLEHTIGEFAHEAIAPHRLDMVALFEKEESFLDDL